MTRLKLFFLFLFLISGGSVICQTDSARVIAYYDLVVNDSTEHASERFMLSIGNKLSVFKSFDRYISDSISAIKYEQVRVGNNIFVKPGDPSGWKHTTTEIYRSNDGNLFTTIDKLLLTTCWIEEKQNAIDWQIQPDTLTINGLLTQKATAAFKGREYEAWFSLTVPYPYGPWKLGGLPGLIVKAKDTKGDFTFILDGLSSHEVNVERRPFSLPVKYMKITRDEFLTTYIRMRQNPMQYLEAQTDMKVSIRGVDNLPPTKVKIPKLYRLEKASE